MVFNGEQLGLELPKRVGPDLMHDPRCSTELQEAAAGFLRT